MMSCPQIPIGGVVEVQKVERPRWPWYNGFLPGYLFGLLFLLLAMALLAVEVSRIITGSLNRNPRESYGLYPGSIFFPPMFDQPNSFNIERQHHYLWPWSNPALLFSIPVIYFYLKNT